MPLKPPSHLAGHFNLHIEPNSRSQSLLLHPRHGIRAKQAHRKRVVLGVLLHVDSVPVGRMRDGKDKVEEGFVLCAAKKRGQSMAPRRDERREDILTAAV